jgi:molecular chaperone GrpE
MENEETVPETEAAPAPEVRVVDKRRFARMLGFGAGGAEAPEDEPRQRSRMPSYVEDLERRAERAEAHARAEIEAARGRLERHYETRLATARAELVAGLLEVYDNLERALDAPAAAESPLYEGVVATRDLFLRRLAELGVEPIPAIGEPFDPELHEAVEERSVDDPALDGRVVAEMVRGFRFGDRLVRPATVCVGRFASETGAEEA